MEKSGGHGEEEEEEKEEEEVAVKEEKVTQLSPRSVCDPLLVSS